MEGPHQARLQSGISAATREIWPEMVEVLKAAGICNYSIFYCNDELFGYYECAKGVAYAEKVQAESPVVDRWNDYMKDILELEMDPRSAPAQAGAGVPSGLNAHKTAKPPVSG